MDFFNYGYGILDLIYPSYAAEAWEDVDKEEIRKALTEIDDRPWTVLKTPKTPSFTAFVKEIDKVGGQSPFRAFFLPLSLTDG